MFISIQEANAAIGSMDFAYYRIVIKGFYMPKRRSSIIITKYLFNVKTNYVFIIKQSDIKIGQLFQKATSFKLLEQLRILLVEKPWGFDEDHLPNKVWMVNVLFTLNPSHPIFRSYSTECKSTLTPEDIRIIQSFNTSLIRQSQGRFFKRTQDQQLKQKKKQKILEKVKKIQELKQQILLLQQDQIQEEQQQ